MGIVFKDSIPKGTHVVFCGGALTKVNEYLKDNYLELLVANGGFVGCNIIEPDDILIKFKNIKRIRTYNFNLDVNSAISVLNNENIDEVILVSKNVCHSAINVFGVLHQDEFLSNYNLPTDKRLHDLLMVKEGCNYMAKNEMICKYLPIIPICDINEIENMSLWRSAYSKDSRIKISTGFKV